MIVLDICISLVIIICTSLVIITVYPHHLYKFSHHYCLPTFNIISTTVAHMLLFFAPTNALISGHPGGLTPGYPRAFAQWRLQIPPTQNQCFFFTKRWRKLLSGAILFEWPPCQYHLLSHYSWGHWSCRSNVNKIVLVLLDFIYLSLI